jgi:hypothetical protein
MLMKIFTCYQILLALIRAIQMVHIPASFTDPMGLWAFIVGGSGSGVWKFFGGTVGAGLHFGYSKEEGFFWGTIQWAGTGPAGGVAASFALDIGFSPEAKSSEDLAGVALEVGGSGGFLKYGGFTKSETPEGIRLFTVSAGPGVGGEVHGYLVGTKVQSNADLWPTDHKGSGAIDTGYSK